MKKILNKTKHILKGQGGYLSQPIGVWLSVMLCLILLRIFFYKETTYYINEFYLYIASFR